MGLADPYYASVPVDATYHCDPFRQRNYCVLATRNPVSLTRKSGVQERRLAERASLGPANQEPPRTIWPVPEVGPVGSSARDAV